MLICPAGLPSSPTLDGVDEKHVWWFLKRQQCDVCPCVWVIFRGRTMANINTYIIIIMYFSVFTLITRSHVNQETEFLQCVLGLH